MDKHAPLCPFNVTQQTGCKCYWIRLGKLNELDKWLKWANLRACCETGLVAAPNLCPWHSGVSGRVEKPNTTRR